jgi:hypothetical protein
MQVGLVWRLRRFDFMAESQQSLLAFFGVIDGVKGISVIGATLSDSDIILANGRMGGMNQFDSCTSSDPQKIRIDCHAA